MIKHLQEQLGLICNWLTVPVKPFSVVDIIIVVPTVCPTSFSVAGVPHQLSIRLGKLFSRNKVNENILREEWKKDEGQVNTATIRDISGV
jgi:hypothetical protein